MTNKKRKRGTENRRKWKYLGIAAACALSMLACGCADPETEADAESAMSNSEVSQKAIQALNKSLEKEQGRQIEETFAVPESAVGGDIYISASVEIPTTDIGKGTFTKTLPTVEEAETYLTNGEKLDEISSQYGIQEWWLQKEVNGEEKLQMVYQIQSAEQIANFGNKVIPDVTEFPYKKGNCPTQELEDRLARMTQETQDLFREFGVETMVLDSELGENAGQYMVDVTMTSCKGGLPLVKEDGSFVWEWAFNTDEGVSSFQTNGVIELQEQKKVSIISVDDFLAVVKENAAEGKIKGWNDMVYTKLTLAYCVDSTNLKYFPVWLLYREDNPNVYLCECTDGRVDFVLNKQERQPVLLNEMFTQKKVLKNKRHKCAGQEV